MKRLVLFIMVVTTVNTVAIPAIAASRDEPVPLYGSYIRILDRSNQTFNGKLNANKRPQKQKEIFFTECEATTCVAHTPNLYTPPGAPKYIDYHWVNNRWELIAEHLFNCNDGSKVKSTLFEFLVPSGNGNFLGERQIKINGPGCPGEGSGIYKIPFKLVPLLFKYSH